MDFNQDVIARSHTIPVLVDFWAPWCGPCRVLGPVLDELASESAGQWELVKVNTEEAVDIAQQYHVMSIPNVKLFYRGEVIDEFTGALPKSMVLDWLKKALPTPGAAALDALLASNPEPTVKDVEELQSLYPDEPAIRLVLAELIFWENPGAALDLLDPIKLGHAFYDKAEALRNIGAFLLSPRTDESLVEIRTFLRNSAVEEAIQRSIEVLGKNPKADEGLLAKAAIGIFNTMGHQHRLTKAYRRKLDMVLWV